MNIQYVSKLFYGQYAYKVVLYTTLTSGRWWPKQDEPTEFTVVTVWCEQHVPGAYKILRRFQDSDNQSSDWHQMIYLQSEHMKDALVKQFGAHVTEVWQPLNQAHLQTLEVRNITEVRSQLIYKKYSHVVYFKYDRQHVVYPWLEKLLADSPKSAIKGCRWFPKVYSADEADVQMIKLSYPEMISYIKQVVLLPS